jgi:hypothetical protein
MPQVATRADHLVSLLHLGRLLFLGRHKYYHFRVWYRDALSRYAREMLLDEPTLARHIGTAAPLRQSFAVTSMRAGITPVRFTHSSP